MRTISSLAVMALVLTLAGSIRAEEKKEGVTLKGDIACAKCVYKIDGLTACTNAIKVKDGDKEVVYLIDDEGKKEAYHAKVCTAAGKGSVTGTVWKKGEAMHIKPDAGGVKLE